MNLFEAYKVGAGQLIGRTGRGLQALGTQLGAGQIVPGGLGAQMQIVGRQMNPLNPPSVKGAETAPETNVNWQPTNVAETYQQYSPFDTTTTPTGDGKTTTPTTTTPGTTEDPNAALYTELDNIYNETVNYLQGRKPGLEASQTAALGSVESQYGAGKTSLEGEKEIGLREAGAAGVTAGQTRESALTAGRRLANELQMGGRQKFGQLSSAGQAYGEIVGREFQRGQATAYQAYQNAMTKITDIKSNIQTRFASALETLNAQKAQAVLAVQTEFRDKLDQIEGMIFQAGQDKSQARLDLLTTLRNQVYELNLAATQTEAALKQQVAEQQKAVDYYTDLIEQSATSANQATQQQGSLSLYPTTNLSLGGTSQAPTTPMTGISSPVRRPEDELYGTAYG